ncbi:hypothetical protein AAVH_28306 [Aphelenchoides avenae]|nr:hypothetical protein AAVH_28306 [Aphelenchus avenae]
MQLYNRWMMYGTESQAPQQANRNRRRLKRTWNECLKSGTTASQVNVANSFKSCGNTTALSGSDSLVHCLKDGNGMPNGCYKLAQKREEAEAADLAELMAGFELDLVEDDVGKVSDAEIVDDPREEGNNNAERDCSDDSQF